MRVVFVWINRGGPLGMSQGVSMLATELAEAGHDVTVLHDHESLPACPTLEHTLRRLLAADPAVVLLSFGTNQAPLALALAADVRRVRPGLPVMAGGVHATLSPGDVLRSGAVGHVFQGEADGRMDRLVQRLAAGDDLADEPGVALLVRGEVHRTPVGPLPDPRRQRLPYLAGIDYRDLCLRMRGTVDVCAGRGCAYQCTYCHNAGLAGLYRADLGRLAAGRARLRMRDPLALLEECRRYRDVCGPALKTFAWGDDVAVSSHPFLEVWAHEYPRLFPDTPFAVNACLPHLDDEAVRLLADAGCNLVKFGLESGSERLRRLLRRPDPALRHLQPALERLERHGLATRAYVIVGLLTETLPELLSTFTMSARLGIDTVRPAVFFPYPGTPLHARCEAEGLIDRVAFDRVRNYYGQSVLRHTDPDVARLIDRIMEIYPILLNAELPGRPGAVFAPLRDRALSGTPADWHAGLRDEVLATQQAWNQRLRDEGAVFYAVPFPDRPDASFLLRRRRRPLVNVDDEAGAPPP